MSVQEATYTTGSKGPPWRYELILDFSASALSAGTLLIASIALWVNPFLGEVLFPMAGWVSLPLLLVALGVLVHDLGRPSRFLNMVRHFNVRSPMSWGVYFLMLHSVGATLALGVSLGWAPAVDHMKGIAIFSILPAGCVLAYKGVLLSGTAVPFWRYGRAFGPLLLVTGCLGGIALLQALGAMTGWGHTTLYKGDDLMNMVGAFMEAGLVVQGLFLLFVPYTLQEDQMILFEKNPISIAWWGGAFFLGTVAPELLYRISDSPLTESVLILVGVVCLRYALLRGPYKR